MSTTTTTITNRDYPQMYSSISSLTSIDRQPPSIPRVYKQASQLFLTRRISEALDVLEPIITPSIPSSPKTHAHDASAVAPIASATKNARCKVWGLYVSILNEVVELGPEDGKRQIGSVRWKELVDKTSSCSVWEEVVQNGYNGNEGSVDIEVVALLATLLLAHAPSQRVTQQRLETYLSITGQPDLDIAKHMAQEKHIRRPDTFHASGTSTPRDLNQRLKILEIFTLYVLPRNQEWEYAKQFIQMSEILDDDRKEAFLQALQALQDEPKHEAQREEALNKQRREQMESRLREERDDMRRQSEAARKQQDRSPSQSSRQSYIPAATEPRSSTRLARNSSAIRAKPSSSTQPGKAPKPPGLGFVRRAMLLLSSAQQNVLRMGSGIWRHPLALLRLLLFIVALMMALARRDIRLRVEQVLKLSWDKVRRTAGMAVKVTYV